MEFIKSSEIKELSNPGSHRGHFTPLSAALKEGL